MASYEEKHENFVRLAEARTNACLDKIRLIGNLSSPNYEKSMVEVAQVFAALRTELDKVESGFLGVAKVENRFGFNAIGNVE